MVIKLLLLTRQEMKFYMNFLLNQDPDILFIIKEPAQAVLEATIPTIMGKKKVQT